VGKGNPPFASNVMANVSNVVGGWPSLKRLLLSKLVKGTERERLVLLGQRKRHLTSQSKATDGSQFSP
jgi:hypothetical protein